MNLKRVLLLIFLFLTLKEILALDNHAVAGGAAPPALEFDSDLSPTSWAWMGDPKNPRYQQVKQIHNRFVDFICDHPELKKHIIHSSIEPNELGDPELWVAIRYGLLEETKTYLPREFEGIPVVWREAGPQFSKMIPFCSQHLASWIGDSTNPRYQELVKIHQRFSDFLGERLEPYEQFVSTGIRADEHGNPVFHVGVRPEWLEEAKRRIPSEFEGITVELEGCGPLEFLKKK